MVNFIDYLLNTDIFTNYSSIIILIIGLMVLFIIVLIVHKIYEKSIININPYIILTLAYLLIIINMFLSPKYYSMEWAFLGFIIIAVIFYDFKIDSRLLIFPAVILLGYIPFLLIGAQKETAENIAVFVYYFLVVGVILQIIENYYHTKTSIDFERFFESIMKKEKILYLISVLGIITIGIIILNRFRAVELLKWSSVYVFALLIVFYLIASFLKQK